MVVGFSSNFNAYRDQRSARLSASAKYHETSGRDSRSQHRLVPFCGLSLSPGIVFFLKCGISLIPGLEFCKPLVSVSISSSLERMILDDTEYTGGQGGVERGKPPLAFKIYTLPLRQKKTPHPGKPQNHTLPSFSLI